MPAMQPAADPAMTDRGRIGILVLGMHRSGTSALTWLLGQMGAALPSDAIAGGAENRKGYWESAGLVAADERLLRSARSSWFDPRPLQLSRLSDRQRADCVGAIRAALADGWGDAPLLAIKDPRICRFVPVFAAALRDAGIELRAVLMLRPAAEVAASIRRRDGTTLEHGLLLWLRHMLEAERDSRAMPRAIVRFDALLHDWRETADRLASLLGRAAWQPTDEEREGIDSFFEPALRHRAELAIRPEFSELRALIEAAERAFAALAIADDEAARAALDRASADLAAMPWIEGDVVHDELRHRRAPAKAPDAVADPLAAADAPPAPSPAPPPPEPLPDPDGDARLIRESGLFDADWYRATYPDSREGGLDPVDHYLRIGAAKGYNPNPLFDTGYYARQMARRSARP